MDKVGQINYRLVIVVIVAGLLFAPIGIILAKSGHLRYLLVTPIVLIGFSKRIAFPSSVRAALIILCLAVMLVYGGQWASTLYQNISTPPEWDFHVLWLNGRVAHEGLNFYDTASYYSVAERYFEFDNGFAEQALDPSFIYPPPSMFIFAPLGWFDVQPAIILWYIVQMIFVLLCIYTAWKMFAQEEGLIGLLFVATMVLILRPSLTTISFAQLNFMMLLMILLALKDREHPRAGLWLALGSIMKPIIAILLIYFFLKRQWKTLALTVLTLLVLSVLAIFAYGLDNFIPYFTDNPTERLPHWQYYESYWYQSLYTTTIQITHFDMDTGSPFLQPLFFIPALLLTLVTVVLVYRIKAQDFQIPLYVLTLMMALLLYPYTQIYYGILILPLVFVLWSRQEILGVGVWPSIIIITVIYTLTSKNLFYSSVFCWLFFAFIAGRYLWQERASRINNVHGGNTGSISS